MNTIYSKNWKTYCTKWALTFFFFFLEVKNEQLYWSSIYLFFGILLPHDEIYMGSLSKKIKKNSTRVNPCYGLGMSAGIDLLREQRPSMEAVISSFLCSFILIKPQKIKPNKTTPNIWWVRELFSIFVGWGCADGTWDFIHTAKCVPA